MYYFSEKNIRCLDSGRCSCFKFKNGGAYFISVWKMWSRMKEFDWEAYKYWKSTKCKNFETKCRKKGISIPSSLFRRNISTEQDIDTFFLKLSKYQDLHSTSVGGGNASICCLPIAEKTHEEGYLMSSLPLALTTACIISSLQQPGLTCEYVYSSTAQYLMLKGLFCRFQCLPTSNLTHLNVLFDELCCSFCSS